MIPVVACAGVLANATLGSGGAGGFGCGCAGGLGAGSTGAGGGCTLAGSPDDAPPLVVTAILLISCAEETYILYRLAGSKPNRR